MTERLESIVRALATPAGREVGSAGHEDARRYLLAEMGAMELAGYGASGFEHPYTRDGIHFCNLLGVLPGSRPELSPVLIGAHYDTCGPFPGADDNAAAVAIALTMVEPLRIANLERSVIFAFFDAEEPPHFLSESMGSTRWYQDQRLEETHCAIVLDLVGHDVPIPGLEDVLFVTGMESDPELEPIFRASASRATIRPIPTLTSYIGDMSDYRPFRLDRRPYLFFSCAQWEHYHEPTDTPDKLNYEKMAGTADYLVEVTTLVAATDLRGPFEGYDTTSTEIEYFQSTAGVLLDQVGIKLEGRRGIDALAEQLTAFFLR